MRDAKVLCRIERLYESVDDDTRRSFNAYLVAKWGLPMIPTAIDRRERERARKAEWRAQRAGHVPQNVPSSVPPDVPQNVPPDVPQNVPRDNGAGQNAGHDSVVPGFSSLFPDKNHGQVKQDTREIRQKARVILAFLNEKTGRTFRFTDVNLRLIEARLKSGATVQDCKAVIARKCREWKTDPKMAAYLRPATLFNATKFEQYLGEREAESDA